MKEIRKNWSRVLKTAAAIMVFRNTLRVYLYAQKAAHNQRKEAVNMSYVLQTNHLTKKMDGKELIKDVNIHVKKGEIYGFLGPKGA